MRLSGAAGLSMLLAGNAIGCSKAKESYDVVVVGAGVIGCCAARELARYNASVLVLEKGSDIANGATRANSGIVHVGFDPKPGTLKAKYNVAGAGLFEQWQSELGFLMRSCATLVLAFTQSERETLEELRQRGIDNGAQPTRIVEQEELRQLEPSAPSEAVAALYAPTSSIVDPYGLAFAVAENAADNGVEFAFDSAVGDIVARKGSYELTVKQTEGESRKITCKAVLNAAGVYADEINNLVSGNKLQIVPKRGEYLLYESHSPFNHVMFQAPTEKGKGVLVASTVFGNAFIGPNSVKQESKEDVSTTEEGLADILEKAKRTWPEASGDNVISTFAGLRATNADTGDFVIGEAPDAPGFFNAACIDSPGLASAPAIAQDIAAQIAVYLGASEKDAFNPNREAFMPFAYADDATKAKMIAEDPGYGVTVCSCYGVTQAEVAKALHGKLPVSTIDALKWRTGATMGACQGGKCLARVAELIVQQTGIDATDIQKRASGSTLGVASVAEDVALDIELDFDLDESVVEKPRAAYLIPGARCAGVHTAREVLDLMKRDRLLVGENVLVWGKTELANMACDALERAGAQVARLDEGLRVVGIRGNARVELVVCADEAGNKTSYQCDSLVISHDTIAL